MIPTTLLRPIGTLAACLLLAAGLTACESARKVIGNEKSVPDEFAVYQRPPLSVPNEFKLQPPEPGRDRPQAITPTLQARAALAGREATMDMALRHEGKMSSGTMALLERTGAPQAAPNIRQIVNLETQLLDEEDRRVIDRMIFWVDDKPYPGTVVDADKEKKRIQENQALGKAITEGETPKITLDRGRKGLLEF